MPTVLHLDERRSAKVKKINRGMFSTIYENLDAPEIFAVTSAKAEDYSKEIVANAIDWRGPNPYLPKIQKLGVMSDSSVIYGMPKYRAPLIKAASAVAWSEARVLQKYHATALRQVSPNEYAYGYQVNMHVVECARDSGLSRVLVDALDVLASNAADYGQSYMFEFPVRNLATDTSGHLVLLDVLFDRDSVRKINRERGAKVRLKVPTGWPQ
jgi:hypothetical protein